MKLTFRKHEVKDLRQLEQFVTEHADAIEPGCKILASGVNLGRSTVDLAGLDPRQTPMLVALGFAADDEMLFRMIEAFAWCLEYPESLRRLVGDGRGGWPPRVVFVAERVLESFVRKIRLLKFPVVDCFEYRCVEVNGATGFYLDAVDCSRTRAASPSDGSLRPAARPRDAGLTEPAPLEFAVEPVVLEHPAVPDKRLERHEPVATLVNGQNGRSDGGPTHRLEDLMAPLPDPVEPKPAVEPEVPAASAESSGRSVPDGPGLVDIPADLGLTQRIGLDELDLPGRELAPTWRKFLEKLAGGLDALAATPVQETAPAPRDQEPTPPPAPASPPPRARGGAGPAAPRGDKRVLIDGVQLPVNGELAPQWRKFLDKPSIEEAKISAVKEYLHREFPLCTIYDFFEFQRNGHVFQLQDNQGKVSQLATISVEFFEAHREAEIRSWVEKHKLAQAMRQAGQAGLFVGATGVQIEKR